MKVSYRNERRSCRDCIGNAHSARTLPITLLPGAPNIRHFDSIGSLGESMIVKMEDVGDYKGMFAGFETARIILGASYE